MKLKKILSSVIAAAMVLSSIGTAFAYEEPIAKAVEEVGNVALQTAAVSEEDAKVTVEFSGGLTLYYDSLKQAMDDGSSGTKTIIVHEDITEEIDVLQGNITTDNPNGVTITSTYDNWIYCSGLPESLTIGENITFKAPALFVYDKNCVINGTVIVNQYYQRYKGSKLTINEPGNMTVTGDGLILRYMDEDPNAGIYIVGDNDNSTIGLTAQVIYFYQGMINAKDANIKVGTYWQTNTTDNEGSANLVLDNSTLDVTVNEHKAKATGNSTVTVKNGSEMNVAGGFEQGENATVSVDSTSSIAKNGTSVYVASIGEEPYETLQEAYDAATSSDTITLLSDVTVSDWQYAKKGITLNGNDHTITVESVSQNTISNGGMMFRSESADEDINISNVTFNLCDTAMVAYTVEGNFENVTINGGKYGLNLSGATQVSNCTFNSQKREAIYFKDVTGAPGAVIEKCTFNLASKRVGALWSNEVFKNNTINYEGEAITGLTILSNSSATVSGNVMSADTKLEFYVPDNSPATFTLTENNIAGSVFVDGAEVADQFDGATIENNTLSAEALAGLQLIKNDIVSVDPVATLNGKGYYNLQDALEAAEDGDTITLLAGTYPAFTVPTDKNNLTIAGVTDADGNNLVTIETLNKDFVTTPGVSWVNGYCVHAKAETVTFRNLNFTAGVSAGAEWYFGSITSGHDDYDSSNGNNNLKNLIIDKCNFIGSGSHYAVWVNDGNVTVSDSTISGYQLGIDNYAMGANEVMNISNTTITNVNNPFHTGDAVAGAQINVTDSVIDSNVIHVGGAVAVNVTDSKISNADVETWSTSSINISESSLYNTTYKVNDNSAITLNKNYADNVNELVVLASADEKITYETYYKTEEDLENGNLTVLPDKAETIYVQFRNTNPDAEDMANSVWEIVLVGDEEIHELASVDLTFENNSKLAADTTKENPYTIVAKAGMTLSKKGDNHYMFSFDANTVEETNTEISLGTITFGGYGALNFKVDATATTDNQNIANATEIANSIVETFVVGGATDSDDKTGDLVINTDAPDALDKEGNLVGVIGGTSVEVPSRNLKINVTFPNAVIEQNYKYQDMVVTVKGTNIATSKVDTFTYNLGTEGDKAMNENGNYVIENIKLSQNGTYTVTVTGAGYRTVSYDVHMTDDKELTFWNNVMDAPKVVEKDNADSTETVTFLAGDIVKDDNINIYDLSAVVSYFATPTTTTGYDEKAQYDLNRDGMIDSKDVAYVLVSWGK